MGLNIIEEMKKMSLQFFEQKKHKENLINLPMQDLLPFIRCTRALFSFLQIAFARDKKKEGELFLSSIFDIAKKINLNGKVIMRLYVVGNGFKISNI